MKVLCFSVEMGGVLGREAPQTPPISTLEPQRFKRAQQSFLCSVIKRLFTQLNFQAQTSKSVSLFIFTSAPDQIKTQEKQPKI